MTVLALAFGIGALNGLRSFTPPAVTAWAAHLRWVKLQGALALIGSVPVVAIFTLLAAFELVADKMPWIPDRTTTMKPRRARRHGRADRRMRCRGRRTVGGHWSRLWRRRQHGGRLRWLSRPQAFGTSAGRAGYICRAGGGPDVRSRRSMGSDEIPIAVSFPVNMRFQRIRRRVTPGFMYLFVPGFLHSWRLAATNQCRNNFRW